MTDLPTDLTERLRELEAKAIPGPWHQNGPVAAYGYLETGQRMRCCGAPTPTGECCGDGVMVVEEEPVEVDVLRGNVDDIALIVALRNSLSEIISSLEELSRLKADHDDLVETADGLEKHADALDATLAGVRAILAGADLGSLPYDYLIEQMARDRMAELSRLKAGEGWKPIETCPRETPVLVSDGETAVIGSLTLVHGWEFASLGLASQPRLWHRLPLPPAPGGRS